jgi:hypothetical protein
MIKKIWFENDVCFMWSSGFWAPKDPILIELKSKPESSAHVQGPLHHAAFVLLGPTQEEKVKAIHDKRDKEARGVTVRR